MQCKSCQGEVPPKFSHAILVNICPLCGDEIMEPELQAALKDLKVAMTWTAQYPNQIFDWLKSNYNLYTEEDLQLKIKSMGNMFPNKTPNVSAKMPPSKTEDVQLDEEGNQITGNSLQSPTQTNKFFKNALATRVLDQQQHFKDIANRIKNGVSVGGGSNVITADMIEGIEGMEGDGEPIDDPNELSSLFDDGKSVQSGIDPDLDYDDDEIPDAVLQMANLNGKGNAGKDAAMLKRQLNKSKNATNQMARGGGIGLIRR